MTREEALKKCEKTLKTISRHLDNLEYECHSSVYKLDDDEMGWIFYCRDLADKTLDAIIDPKDEYAKSEEAWKEEFEKNQSTTCKVCLKKAYDNHETAWPTTCTCDDGWKPWPPSKSLQYDPYSYANIIMKTDDEGSIRWWRQC